MSTDPTLGTTGSVGKYFGLVSTLPSVVLAAWVYLLLASGAWDATPSLETLAKNSPLDHGGAVLATAAFALAVAVVSHPVQFVLVQLLEGYWGSSALGRRAYDAMVMRQLAVRARADEFTVGSVRAGRQLAREAAESEVKVSDPDEYLSGDVLRDHPHLARLAVERQSLKASADSILAGFPEQRTAILPTRLGNMLRRHELLAGAAVKLPVLDWATHLGMVTSTEQGAYINDQRTQLDLAVRTTAMGAVAAIFTFALLWDEKGWALLTLVPYFVMWLGYRGAVTSADGYGRALRAWVDLNRFRLYEALGLPPVTSAQAERQQNKKLDNLMRGLERFESELDPPTRATK